MEEKKEYKSNFRVISLSSYQTPVVKEEYNKDYIKFGDNNDYFEKLVDNYLSSATNSRCISGISDMIYGRGLELLYNQYIYLMLTHNINSYQTKLEKRLCLVTELYLLSY
jgi:hypothetical protein